MPTKKIACLGGGSLYFTRALPDLAVTQGLAGSEVVLYDIDLEKAQRMARHGARLASGSGTGLKVRACETLAEALDGADFVITSIGGVGESTGNVYGTGYHQQDILIPAKYGIYQLIGDTGGPAGMMMALRSIPIYLNICHEMEKRCPHAILFNHSNPLAVLVRAMVKYSSINVVGICHGVQAAIVHVANILGVSPHALDVLWVGTNHYHWFTRIRHNGQDVYPEVRRRMAERAHNHGEAMTEQLSQNYGYQLSFLNDDHTIEFYPYLTQLPNGDKLPYNLDLETWLPTGYIAPEAARSHDLNDAQRAAERQAQWPAYEKELAAMELPAEMSDPLTGEGLGSLLESISLGRRQVYVANITNHGSVPNLPDYAILEIEGVTDRSGVRGLYMGDAPLALQGKLHRRIVWQELVADAGAKGDRGIALQALQLDEMAIRPDKAACMLDELLVASKPMLPQFK